MHIWYTLNLFFSFDLSDGAVKSFLTRFPYSPPYLLNSLVCAVGAAAMIFLLPETLVKYVRL